MSRTRSQKKGRGLSLTYQSPSHRHENTTEYAELFRDGGDDILREGRSLVRFIHSPGNKPALAVFTGGYTFRAVRGNNTNSRLFLEPKTPNPQDLNIVRLNTLTPGTIISNVGLTPNRGPHLARSHGQSVRVSHVDREKNLVTIVFNSRKEKILHGACLAILGEVSGSGKTSKPILKIGVKRRMYSALAKRPITVTAQAMNAFAHPYGGGSHQAVKIANSVSYRTPPGRKVGRLGRNRSIRRRNRMNIYGNK